jgi:uncharacterized repeat protein (TIGR01451 family)
MTGTLAVGFYPIYGAHPADQSLGGVTGTISGSVSVSGTLASIPEAMVTATSFLNTFTTTTNTAGDYIFPGICADLYTLQATAPDYHPSSPVTAQLRWANDIIETDFAWVPISMDAVPAITKTVDITQVEVDGMLTYTISLTNPGPGELTNAVLSDTLPAEVIYISSTPPAIYHSGTVTWTIESLPPGGSDEITITCKLAPETTAGTIITNTAYLLWDISVISSSVDFQVPQTPIQLLYLSLVLKE